MQFSNLNVIKVMLNDDTYYPQTTRDNDPLEIYGQMLEKFPENVQIDVLDSNGYSLALYMLFVPQKHGFMKFTEYVKSSQFDPAYTAQDGNNLVHFCLLFDLFRLAYVGEFLTADCLKSVIDAGVDINAPNARGNPPITIAAALEVLGPLRRLLMNNAVVNIKSTEHMNKYLSETGVSKITGEAPIIQSLLFSAHPKTRPSRASLEDLVGKEAASFAYYDTAIQIWSSPIMKLSLRQQAYFVLATEGNADLTVMSNEGNSVLSLAVVTHDEQFLLYLLTKPTVLDLIHVPNREGKTPFLLATDANLANILITHINNDPEHTSDPQFSPDYKRNRSKSIANIIPNKKLTYMPRRASYGSTDRLSTTVVCPNSGSDMAIDRTSADSLSTQSDCCVTC